MIIILKYANFFLLFIYKYVRVIVLLPYFVSPSFLPLFLPPSSYVYPRVHTPAVQVMCVWVLASLLNGKQNKQRGGAHGNMATATEYHGRLLRDRKSIPGSRYGSHRDCDSALYRDSGWNSFEYWLRSGSCCCCHHSDWPVLYLELGVLYPDICKKL